jgi:hypothetical protein
MSSVIIPYHFNIYCRIHIDPDEFDEEDYEELRDQIIYQKIYCIANITEKNRNKFNNSDGLMCLASNALTGDWDGQFDKLKNTEYVDMIDDDTYGYFNSFGEFNIIQSYNLPESTDIEIVEWL